MKTRKISLAIVITMLIMLVASFGMSLKANAVFDNNFDVTWGSNTSNITGSANSMDDSFSKIIDKYKTVITFVSAIGAVTMVAVFILNFMKLGTTAGNPTERSKCITALIWSGLAAAGLGSVALVVGIFYGALRD